jgi:hypothetical protein
MAPPLRSAPAAAPLLLADLLLAAAAPRAAAAGAPFVYLCGASCTPRAHSGAARGLPRAAAARAAARAGSCPDPGPPEHSSDIAP